MGLYLLVPTLYLWGVTRLFLVGIFYYPTIIYTLRNKKQLFPKTILVDKPKRLRFDDHPKVVSATVQFGDIHNPIRDRRSAHKCYSPAHSRRVRGYCRRTPVRSTTIGTMRTSRTDRWQYRYGALIQYTNRTGTSIVPATQVEVYEGKNVALGAWVAYNRQQYRAGELPASRQEALQKLTGWHWEKQKPGRRYDRNRDSEITLRYKSGERVGLIAKSLNLSRQRVHQILKKNQGITNV